jgi:hypothetical protein
VVGEPESGLSAAAAVVSALPVESGGEAAFVVLVEVVAPGPVVVDGVVPGVAVVGEPDAVEPPAAVEPDAVLELPGLGVLAAGFGVGTGGLLDELDDGLGLGDGFGDGFGVLDVAAGGALLGAPPDPNAKPMTLPGAGS